MPETRSCAPEPPQLVPAPRRARLLVVDDEPQITAQFEQVFTSLGYEVDACTDPFDARSRFMAEPAAFDLVLTDFAMPGLDGYAFSRLVLAQRPALPVLVYSGFLTQAAIENLNELGVSGILMKPTSLAIITQTVAQQVNA